jgi:lysophosphatidate acyltransferase
MSTFRELDVLILGCIFPKYCSVTAKKSLKWMPFLGWFMALSKTVFIDRGNRKAAVSAFDSAAETMHNDKQSVFIFPEGTRSYADKPMLLPFKKGAFHLAIQAQVPIVPCVCANYSHVLNVKKRVFNAGRIPVSILKPIETKGMKSEDAAALCDRVRDMMLEELLILDKEVKAQSGHLNGSAKQQPSKQRQAMTTGADRTS